MGEKTTKVQCRQPFYTQHQCPLLLIFYISKVYLSQLTNLVLIFLLYLRFSKLLFFLLLQVRVLRSPGWPLFLYIKMIYFLIQRLVYPSNVYAEKLMIRTVCSGLTCCCSIVYINLALPVSISVRVNPVQAKAIDSPMEWCNVGLVI